MEASAKCTQIISISLTSRTLEKLKKISTNYRENRSHLISQLIEEEYTRMTNKNSVENK